jgi:hypothetical protein
MANQPLKGFLARESDGEVRVDVSGGTWIVQRADIEHQSDWEDAPKSLDASGKAVQVAIRPGARIGFLQSVTVQALDRPITLPEQYSKVAGSDSMSKMTEQWGRTHGFELDVKVAEEAGHTSVSCWDSPGGFGTTCKGDDCM